MVEAPLDRREAPPSLDRDGYVVLPELLPAAAVASVRRAVGQKLDGPVVGACERPNNTLVPLRWNDDVVAAVTGDAVVDRLTAALAAADLRWISGYVSVKAPHSPPLWWHQDWWCWDHPVSYRRAPAQVALLTYLSDTHTGNGALRVLPGSHRHSVPLHAALPEAHSDESTALDPGHDAMRDQQGQATVALHAGDAVVLDYRLLHGTHANTTGQRRDCVLLTFAPAWAGLPLDIRGHLISHPALPTATETPPSDWPVTRLLPTDDGQRRDLDLNRDAPHEFAISG